MERSNLDFNYIPELEEREPTFTNHGRNPERVKRSFILGMVLTFFSSWYKCILKCNSPMCYFSGFSHNHLEILKLMYAFPS